MAPYDVQILGGIALHKGYLAEMNTGEGKTLVATMPLYLNALTGKSVILVTVNDYLAKRDAEEMGPVYRFMGLTVSAGGEEVEYFIKEKCRLCNLKNCKVVILDYLTDGQATTAMLAQEYWDQEHALLIYNIDTYVEAGGMKSTELKGDGFIPCFRGEGDHWSFVRLDESGRAAEIKEKQRISDYCTIGAYYFKTCRLYKDLYQEFYGQTGKLVKGEKYVAPLYDHLLSLGGEIYISVIAPEKVHVLGTPEELQDFLDI